MGISIHALRGEGDAEARSIDYFRQISIHALRGEGDFGYFFNNSIIKGGISIHALRGEGDEAESEVEKN